MGRITDAIHGLSGKKCYIYNLIETFDTMPTKEPGYVYILTNPSSFVGTFMPADKRNASGAYQGAKFFIYKGEVLDAIRTRIEFAEEAG